MPYILNLKTIISFYFSWAEGELGSIADLEQHKLISNMFASPNSFCGQLANQQRGLADLDYSSLVLRVWQGFKRADISYSLNEELECRHFYHFLLASYKARLISYWEEL